jgi:cytochrome c
MFKCTNATVVLSLSLMAASGVAFSQNHPNLGRAALPQEIAAWDIDVRPDFKGLPKGSGTVAKGAQVWEGKCASCHGAFGESAEVFQPIVGGTTQDDIKTGRVATLKPGAGYPNRTTIMKVGTLSSLWDYIHRAMPWTAPKSLTTEEVYSVLAYILNLAEIVPDDFTLSDQNISEVQQRMPNRNGMTTHHGMWDVKGKPDVKSVACMKNCPVEDKIRSYLPEAYRNAHGNLAQQNRTFGPIRGADTTKPTPTEPITSATRRNSLIAVASVATPKAASSTATKIDGSSLVKTHACVACHGISNKIIGPGFTQIAAKYKGDVAAKERLADKIKNGSSGVWGSVAMPPQAQVKADELKTIVSWILSGAK